MADNDQFDKEQFGLDIDDILREFSEKPVEEKLAGSGDKMKDTIPLEDVTKVGQEQPSSDDDTKSFVALAVSEDTKPFTASSVSEDTKRFTPAQDMEGTRRFTPSQGEGKAEDTTRIPSGSRKAPKVLRTPSDNKWNGIFCPLFNSLRSNFLAYDCAARLCKIGELAACDHLHDKVPDGRSFRRASKNLKACCLGSKSVEIKIFRSATDNIYRCVCLASNLRKILNGIGIARGKRLINALHQLANRLRCLSFLLRGSNHLRNHRIRIEKPRVVNIDSDRIIFRASCGHFEIGEGILAPLLEILKPLKRINRLVVILALNIAYAIELAANRLNHPKTHDVLQEPIPAPCATLVRKVRLHGGLCRKRLVVLHSEKRPCAA